MLTAVIYIVTAYVILIVSYWAFCDALYARDEPENIALLIILGIAPKNKGCCKILQNRMDKAAELIRKFPDCTVILSGGKTNGAYESEAVLMRDMLKKHGKTMEPILDCGSRTTYQNFKNIKTIAGGKSCKDGYILTSGYHLLRALAIAKLYGLSLGGIPVKTPYSALPPQVLRESLSILKFVFIYFFRKGKFFD